MRPPCLVQPTVSRRKLKSIEMGFVVPGEGGNLIYTEEGREWLERDSGGDEETN